MKFIASHVNKEHRMSIGREIDSGRYYLAIPVANRLVDYEEYYEISAEKHDAYPSNTAELVEFAEHCRARKRDELLFIRPGADRGVA